MAPLDRVIIGVRRRQRDYEQRYDERPFDNVMGADDRVVELNAKSICERLAQNRRSNCEPNQDTQPRRNWLKGTIWVRTSRAQAVPQMFGADALNEAMRGNLYSVVLRLQPPPFPYHLQLHAGANANAR